METLLEYWNITLQFLDANYIAILVGVVATTITMSFAWVGQGIFRYTFRGLIPRWYSALRRRNRLHIILYANFPAWRQYYEKAEQHYFRSIVIILIFLIYLPIMEHADYSLPPEYQVDFFPYTREELYRFSRILFGIFLFIVAILGGKFLRFRVNNRGGSYFAVERDMRNLLRENNQVVPNISPAQANPGTTSQLEQ